MLGVLWLHRHTPLTDALCRWLGEDPLRRRYPPFFLFSQLLRPFDPSHMGWRCSHDNPASSSINKKIKNHNEQNWKEMHWVWCISSGSSSVGAGGQVGESWGELCVQVRWRRGHGATIYRGSWISHLSSVRCVAVICTSAYGAPVDQTPEDIVLAWLISTVVPSLVVMEMTQQHTGHDKEFIWMEKIKHLVHDINGVGRIRISIFKSQCVRLRLS